MNKTKIFNFIRKILFKNLLSEKIIVTFSNGKELSSFFWKIPANYYQYSPNTIRLVKRNDINYKLDISDYMEWLIYFGIRTEPRETLYDLAKNAKVIFDIGANVGETTLNFAKITNDNAIVHSFEPSDLCFNKLVYNISLNTFRNIVVNSFGLGETEASYYLSPDFDNNRGGNRIRLNSQNKHNIQIKKMASRILYTM